MQNPPKTKQIHRYLYKKSKEKSNEKLNAKKDVVMWFAMIKVKRMKR